MFDLSDFGHIILFMKEEENSEDISRYHNDEAPTKNRNQVEIFESIIKHLITNTQWNKKLLILSSGMKKTKLSLKISFPKALGISSK